MTRMPIRLLAVAAIAAGALSLSGCSFFGQLTNQTARDDDGAVTESNDDASAFDIKVGDCLNDAATSGAVSTVPIVPCDEPHDSEAYASIILDDGEFPGDDAVKARAEADCQTEFETFVGTEYTASTLDFNYYFPSEDSWAQGDREILCEVYAPDSQTTGTLQDSQR